MKWVIFVKYWTTKTDIKQQWILWSLGLPNSKHYDLEKLMSRKTNTMPDCHKRRGSPHDVYIKQYAKTPS
jgi:hypothetical protein